MADRNHNTTPAPPKGASNQSPNQAHFDCANQARFERANQSSHEPNKISHNSRRINHIPKINRHKITRSISLRPRPSSITLTTLGDGHTMPSKTAATPSAPTKVEKLMDTLSDSFERCYALLRTDSTVCAAVDSHKQEIVFLVDTPVEIEKGF